MEIVGPGLRYREPVAGASYARRHHHLVPHRSLGLIARRNGSKPHCVAIVTSRHALHEPPYENNVKRWGGRGYCEKAPRQLHAFWQNSPGPCATPDPPELPPLRMASLARARVHSVSVRVRPAGSLSAAGAALP